MRKILMTIAAILMALPFAVSAAPPKDALVKASGPAVYYYANDGKRYVFPNTRTYASWFSDFSGIFTVTDAELAAMPLGGNVRYRPGIRMLKIQTDPKVYAVDRGGVLRWVTTQSIADDLYDQYWNTMIDDVSDAYFVNYRIGEPIDSANDFSRFVAAAATDTINADLGISVSGSPRRASTQSTTVVDGWRKYALDHMNALRAQNGKAPLVMNTLLNRIATIHSKDMALNIGELSMRGRSARRRQRIREGKVPDVTAKMFMTVPHPDNVGWSGENVGRRYAPGESREKNIEWIHGLYMDEPVDEPNHRTTMLSTLYPFTEVGIGMFVASNGQFWMSEDFISIQ